MFEKMISDLQHGRAPLIPELQKRFAAALTKKLGVLKQPYLLRPNDPKINPSATHLLWAALILEDPDGFELVKGIIITEMHERTGSAAGGNSENEEVGITALVDELLSLAPDDDFRNELIRRVEKTCS